jgi:hypothetical protein
MMFYANIKNLVLPLSELQALRAGSRPVRLSGWKRSRKPGSEPYRPEPKYFTIVGHPSQRFRKSWIEIDAGKNGPAPFEWSCHPNFDILVLKF